MEKPFSQACENNKAPIIAVLKEAFAKATNVLEVGSGTGQHAVHFAPQLPHLQWRTSDLPENHSGINRWIDEHPSANLHRPLLLDADMPRWNIKNIDGVFTANTLHIMSWQSVQNLFAHVGGILQAGGRFCIYGPFNYNGQYTSDSNARFDIWLKEQAPHRAIRHFEEVEKLAHKQNMSLLKDYEMPANNRLLVWRK
ncbi:MAG: class I SAM-dependent methyltransferase [Porticoccaceae bacterium]|nr:class I SAM-dependent methyltransferase [Porticoccaceae bacterium]